MSNRKVGRVIAIFLMSALWGIGVQGQEATPEKTPLQPPAGAANGPNPGPAVKTPGPGERTGDATKPGEPMAPAAQEAVRNFLAIGTPADPAAAKRGQGIFVSNCGFCHGSNAHGGNSGPDLVRSVLVLHDKGTGTEIGPVIHNGRPAKGMPPFNLSEDKIKDIAAFLLSRNQAAANRMEYKILNVVTGDSKAGEAYFTAHCTSCHSSTGDLDHIAAKFEPVALQSRFLYPKAERSLGPGPPPDPKIQPKVTVKLASGETYSGKLEHLDDFSVSLTEASGEHRSWLFESEKGIDVQVNDPLLGHLELLKRYSDADMHNVLAYLETLK